MAKIRNTQYACLAGRQAIRNTRRGFTLIELVIVILVTAIIAGLGTPLVIQMADSFQYTIYRKDLSEKAEAALRRINREIRRLQDQASVITANATTYRFTDVDGIVVQYQFDATDSEIEREYNGVTDVLVSDVTSFSFAYLDDDLSVVAAPTGYNIKFIQIDMTLTSGNNSINYRALIKLRNINHPSNLFS